MASDPPETPADELVEFVLGETGEHLRSIVRYGPGTSEVLYIRGDVEEEHSVQKLESIVETYRDESTGAEQRAQHYTHGDIHCVIECFEDAVETHFPEGEGTGITIAVDTPAAPRIYGFIDELLDRREHLAPREPGGADE